MANEKRLIDANALLASKWWDSIKDDFDKARAKIIVQSCPTVDADLIVYGRWKGDGMGDYRCSACWESYSGADRFHYCPNCGAKMDGDGNEIV